MNRALFPSDLEKLEKDARRKERRRMRKLLAREAKLSDIILHPLNTSNESERLSDIILHPLNPSNDSEGLNATVDPNHLPQGIYI